jgi:hypothetical protein
LTRTRNRTILISGGLSTPESRTEH